MIKEIIGEESEQSKVDKACIVRDMPEKVVECREKFQLTIVGPIGPKQRKQGIQITRKGMFCSGFVVLIGLHKKQVDG